MVAPETRQDRDDAATLARRLARAEAEIESLCGEILERYEEAALVHRLSQRLASVLGEVEIARLVVEEAGRTLGAAGVELWLRQDEALVLAAAVGEGARPRSDPRPDAGARTAVEQGRPWIADPRSDDEAAVAVPLPGPEGTCLGALALRGRSEGRAYRTGEVKLLGAVACLTSAFIRNDRLAERARRAEARERQAAIARQVHRSLLPVDDAVFDGLEIAGGCRAAEEIGGDYYGYLDFGEGRLGLAMADISGHGVGAALYMAAAKGVLQSEARRAEGPADLLARTNALLAAEFAAGDVFATAFVARLEPGGRRFDYSNGGHNPPLVVRAGGGLERLERGGPALGVLRDVRFEQGVGRLGEGDLLVVHTDGLVEARDARRRTFPLEPLVARHRETDAWNLRRLVMEELFRHCGSTPPTDDVTLVVIKATSTPAPGHAA